MDLPKRDKRVPIAPSVVDVATCIDAASCDEHRLAILLAAHGGLRKGRSGLFGVGMSNSTETASSCVCRATVATRVRRRGERNAWCLSRQLKAALLTASVDKRSREEAAALSTRGTAWGTDGLWQMLQRTFLRCDLPRHRLHALRAYFVTVLLNGHMPVHVVRELVGHEDLATTQKYAEVIDADEGAAVGVLGPSARGGAGAAGRESEPRAAGRNDATRDARDGAERAAAVEGVGAGSRTWQRAGNGADRGGMKGAQETSVS